MKAIVLLRLSGILTVVMIVSSCAPSVSTIKIEGESPDAVMGDWRGHRVTSTGMVVPVAVHAIALGDNKYHFSVQSNFDQREDSSDRISSDGRRDGDRLVFLENPYMQVRLEGNRLWGTTDKEAEPFELTHVVRLSPCLGARPPAGAVVLFDGTNLSGWERRDVKQRATPVGWKIIGGSMEVAPGTGDIITQRTFTDFQLHVEFRTPFMPEAREQARGNSGVYLQGRYEIQILDSYGLKGEDNECGGIYKVEAPRVNMCAPPLQWQSYDVTFHAPRFDKEGKKVKDAMLTLLHNGVLIHDNLSVPGPTAGGVDDNVQLPGGILLQDHGNRVQFRNIWLVELKD